jgi:hypothetical protein
MWGWTFESAFANTELNADYWIIKAGGRSIGGSNSPPLLRLRMRGLDCIWTVPDLEEVPRSV